MIRFERITFDNEVKEKHFTKEKKERKLLFLNCHFFKGTKCAQIYSKLVFKDEERMDALTARVMSADDNVDLFVLAEVWGHEIRTKIIERVRLKFPYTWFPKLRTSPVRFDSGLLFASRMPITATGFRGFEELSGWDRRSTKGVAYVVVEGVAYLGTHFDSSNKSKTSPRGAENRVRNLTQTLDLMREIEDRGIARKIVLCGDFNIRERDYSRLRQQEQMRRESGSAGTETREYLLLRDRLRGSGFHDALREKFPSARESPCNTVSSSTNSLSSLWGPSSEDEARIDYFFTKNVETREIGVCRDYWAGRDAEDREAIRKERKRKDKKKEVNPNIYQVSDHYPIYAIINIE